MVNIIRSTQQSSLGRAGINPSAANQSGAAAIGQAVESSGPAMANSAAAINNSIAQFGAAVEAEGAKLFAESKRSHQSALLLDKMSGATEAFTAARIERSRQAVDENGNPTFGTLVQDVGAIGNKLMEDATKTIIDPEVAEQFRMQFGNFVANQKVTALREAAAQQVDFSRATLNKGLNSLTNQAISDTYDQVGTYDNMGRSALDDALASGAISAVEHEKMSRGFSNTIRVESIKNTIEQNRGEAVRILSQSPEDLGIEPDQHARLMKITQAAIKSDHIAAQKAREVQTLDQQVAQAQVVEMLETRMEAGALREDELLGFQDKIAPQKFASLKKKYVQEAAKQQVQRMEFNKIGSRINNGEDLTDMKPAQIGNFYNFMLGQQADISGKKPTLAEEASLASAIPAPVKPFAEKMEYGALHGETGKAAEILEAYTYVKDRKAQALDSGFDKKATAILEHSLLLVEKGGMDPAAAMERAREAVATQKDDVVKARKSEFRKFKEFSDKKLTETAAESLGADSFFGGNKIDPEATRTFKKLTEEGFMMTGDKQAAIEFAKENMSKTYGMSTVGGKEKLVYMPPEKVYPNTSPDLLRRILVEDVKTGIDPTIEDKDISLEADPLTFRRSTPSWVVTQKKQVGGTLVEVPLVNPKTGELVRWSPEGSQLPAQLEAQKLEAAKQKREETVQKMQQYRPDRNTLGPVDPNSGV